MAFLSVEDLVLHYDSPRGAVHAVDGASLTLPEKGNALGIIGETGSGKSSLAMSVARVLPTNVLAYTGRITLAGTELMSLSNEAFRDRIRWRRISVVFQGSMNGFNPVKRLGHQIAEPLEVLADVPRRAARARSRELLESVGLPKELADRYPHELSGGMKQRVAIAMALALDPELVVLDEPTSALDVSVQAQIMNLLKRLKWETGISMIFVTHDIALASEISDRVVVMYGGEIREEGSADEVLADPKDPYTTELLASMPTLHGEARPRYVAGAAPDPVNPPAACRFLERCPSAFDRCRIEAPALFSAGSVDAASHEATHVTQPRHRARCFLVEGGVEAL